MSAETSFAAASPTAVVVTTINPPTPAMRLLADEAAQRGVRVIVIGDRKGPVGYELPATTFASFSDQLVSDSRYARLCPPGHYARKNIGYLQALAAGVSVLAETDDDNFVRPGFFDVRQFELVGPVYSHAGWLNACRLFTDDLVWPRGFPLEYIHGGLPEPPARRSTLICPVQQGLADTDPDVDAIYRMTARLPVEFSSREPVLIGAGTWTPFNSQNTTWHRAVLPLAYLPRHCTFRMTDIWRGMIAQRVLWANGWGLAIGEATVWQQRNDHDLLVDFRDEMPGYLNNARIAGVLSELDIPAGPGRLFEGMKICYDALVGMDLVGAEELGLLEAFEEDFAARSD